MQSLRKTFVESGTKVYNYMYSMHCSFCVTYSLKYLEIWHFGKLKIFELYINLIQIFDEHNFIQLLSWFYPSFTWIWIKIETNMTGRPTACKCSFIIIKWYWIFVYNCPKIYFLTRHRNSWDNGVLMVFIKLVLVDYDLKINIRPMTSVSAAIWVRNI